MAFKTFNWTGKEPSLQYFTDQVNRFLDENKIIRVDRQMTAQRSDSGYDPHMYLSYVIEYERYQEE